MNLRQTYDTARDKLAIRLVTGNPGRKPGTTETRDGYLFLRRKLGGVPEGCLRLVVTAGGLQLGAGIKGPEGMGDLRVGGEGVADGGGDQVGLPPQQAAGLLDCGRSLRPAARDFLDGREGREDGRRDAKLLGQAGDRFP